MVYQAVFSLRQPRLRRTNTHTHAVPRDQGPPPLFHPATLFGLLSVPLYPVWVQVGEGEKGQEMQVQPAPRINKNVNKKANVRPEKDQNMYI